MKRLWEAEHFTLDFLSGELRRIKSIIYFEGVNFEQAQSALVNSGITYLRLTGNWFTEKPKAPINKALMEVDLVSEEENGTEDENVGFLDFITDPTGVCTRFSIDEFCDWLDKFPEKTLIAIRKMCHENKLGSHVKLIDGHLKFKYNK